MPQPIITKARLELLTFLQRTVEEKNISLETLAQQTEISTDVLQRLLGGESGAALDDVLKICLALGVDINLNVAGLEESDEEFPDVMLCEEPIQGSDVYLLHTRQPRSLWLCALVDDEEELDADDTVEFKTFDGYDEQWQIAPVSIYESASDEELEKAFERVSRYLKAYLHWEDEDLRKAQVDGMN